MTPPFFSTPMQSLDTAAYAAFRENSTVLEADSHSDKVLQLSDGNILKIFRLKRRFSSAFFNPYAVRFANNLAALRALAIPCPQPLQIFRLAIDALGHLPMHAVLYQPIPGESLRQVLAKNEKNNQGDAEATPLSQALGAFVAHLHETGIYFRSLHFGNVIVTPDKRFGLIDVADMSIKARPLSPWLVRRNLHHLLRNAEDREWLQRDAGEAFCAGYHLVRPHIPAAAFLQQVLKEKPAA